MADREAACEAINQHGGLVNSSVRDFVRTVLLAYHGESEFDKIEAGATVVDRIGDKGRVLARHSDHAWVRWEDGVVRTSDVKYLELVTPAVVEVGDYVEVEGRGRGIVTVLNQLAERYLIHIGNKTLWASREATTIIHKHSD